MIRFEIVVSRLFTVPQKDPDNGRPTQRMMPFGKFEASTPKAARDLRNKMEDMFPHDEFEIELLIVLPSQRGNIKLTAEQMSDVHEAYLEIEDELTKPSYKAA